MGEFSDPNHPNRPPKILFVATTVLFFKEFLLPFVKHFRRLNWRVDGAGGMNRGWEEAVAAFEHLYEIEMSRSLVRSNPLQSFRQLRQLIQRENYDVVHVHTPIAGFVVRFVLRDLQKQGKVKIIYTAHGFHFYPGGNPIKNAIFYAVERLVAPWTNYLVVMNKADEAAALRLVGPERTVYMPGIGVDINYYSRSLTPKETQAVRKELGLDTQPLFLMIAEFNPGKRHRDALRAFAQMQNRDVHMAFAGVGPLELEMQQLATQLGIADRTHFLGWRKDIPALIGASSAVVLPSEREGLPRAIMESFCRGVPVLATHIRGIEDLVQDDAGKLVAVGDVDALAREMDWIIANPEAAKEMGNRGKERMKLYDLSQILRLHEALYAKVFQSSPNINSASAKVPTLR